MQRRELLEVVLVVGETGRAIGAGIERLLEVFDTRASSDHVSASRSLVSGN
jgi:hypothetical protein